MFNICKKCFKCKKKKLKNPKINLETEKIYSLIQKENGLRVYLNIYHITVFNYILQFFGLGIFHTTLEINDIEYCFKLGFGDESGIFYNRSKDGIDKKWLKEKIYLGNTPYDSDSVNEIFKLYIPFWLGKTYNLFQKNCNDFTLFFASLLLRTDTVINYPEYVNRITIFAQYFNMFYNPIKKLYVNANNSPSISSSLNTEFLSNDNKENNNEEIKDNNNENINNNNNLENNNNANNEKENNKKINENKEGKNDIKNISSNKNKEITKEEENNGG